MSGTADETRREGPGGRVLYGGTFDPPHRRHLEVAASALHLLGGRADGVDFIPSAQPPHKPGRGVLPFSLRCAMVEAALAENGDPRLACNRMEGEREGPSYTWDTLAACRAARPGTRPWFLLGGEDYALLPTWRRGLELPALCHLLVAPRGDVADADAFAAVTRRNWPEARELEPLRAGADAAPRMELPGGGSALLLPLPPEAVSSSEIRTAWLAGRAPGGLARAVMQLLEQHREAVTATWREER